MYLRTGFVYTGPGIRPEFLIFTLCKVGIIIIFSRNTAPILLFITTIADKGGFINTLTDFLFEVQAYLIAFMAGRTLLVTDKKLITDISTSAFKAMNTEVVRVGETALVPGIHGTMKTNFFRDCRRILAKILGDFFEG